MESQLREDFLAGMRSAATGVAIVTTKWRGEQVGVTVSAICSLSLEPPSLLVCLHHKSRAGDAILESGFFCANILSDEQQELSDVFAGRKEGPAGERFAAAEWLPLATGAPALVGALAAFDCTLVREMRWGSHHVLVGSVCDVELGQGRPLLYCDRSYARVALAAQ
ncbi:MAG TPA: flavin reductase family protein [Alphaproteobacteria bacterium]|nr:flavin reductase family protein [Alphaproteobacteria bacterium]